VRNRLGCLESGSGILSGKCGMHEGIRFGTRVRRDGILLLTTVLLVFISSLILH